MKAFVYALGELRDNHKVEEGFITYNAMCLDYNNSHRAFCNWIYLWTFRVHFLCIQVEHHRGFRVRLRQSGSFLQFFLFKVAKAGRGLVHHLKGLLF